MGLTFYKVRSQYEYTPAMTFDYNYIRYWVAQVLLQSEELEERPYNAETQMLSVQMKILSPDPDDLYRNYRGLDRIKRDVDVDKRVLDSFLSAYLYFNELMLHEKTIEDYQFNEWGNPLSIEHSELRTSANKKIKLMAHTLRLQIPVNPNLGFQTRFFLDRLLGAENSNINFAKYIQLQIALTNGELHLLGTESFGKEEKKLTVTVENAERFQNFYMNPTITFILFQYLKKRAIMMSVVRDGFVWKQRNQRGRRIEIHTPEDLKRLLNEFKKQQKQVIEFFESPDDLTGTIQALMIDLDPGHQLRKKLGRGRTWFVCCLIAESTMTYLREREIDFFLSSSGNWLHIRVNVAIDQAFANEFAEKILAQIDWVSMRKQRMRRDLTKPSYVARLIVQALGLRIKLMYSQDYVEIVKGLKEEVKAGELIKFFVFSKDGREKSITWDTSPMKTAGQARTPGSAHIQTGHIASPVRVQHDPDSPYVGIEDRYMYVKEIEGAARIENFESGMQLEDQAMFDPPERTPPGKVWGMVRDLLPEMWVVLKLGLRVIDRCTIPELTREVIEAWYAMGQLGLEYELNDYRERGWIQGFRERAMRWPKEILKDIRTAYDIESGVELSGKALLRMARVVSYKLPLSEELMIRSIGRINRGKKERR